MGQVSPRSIMSSERRERSRTICWVAGLTSLVICSACDEGPPKTRDDVRISAVEAKKHYLGKVRVLLPNQRRNVVVANPREKGQVVFVSPDGSRVESERSNAGQTRILRYRVALIQLVKLKDGRIVDPVMLVKYPRRDDSGGIYYEDSWSVELQWIAPFETSNDGWADFAVSKQIQQYFLLLKSGDEETGWRVMEIDPTRISKVKTVNIPDLFTLTPLKKHSVGKQLWDIHLVAEKEEDQLKSLE